MRAFGQAQAEQEENANEIADRFQTPPTRTRSAKLRADKVSRIQEARENDTMIVSIFNQIIWRKHKNLTLEHFYRIIIFKLILVLIVIS